MAARNIDKDLNLLRRGINDAGYRLTKKEMRDLWRDTTPTTEEMKIINASRKASGLELWPEPPKNPNASA